MNYKDMVRDLLRKVPKASAIDSINKAKAFKKVHAESIKKFKDGKCTDQAASSIYNNLSVFY